MEGGGVVLFEFAEQLMCLREKRGWSQKELAQRAGISNSAIGKYENDTSTPTLQNASAIADVFGVSLDYLSEGQKCRTIAANGLTDEQVQLLTEIVQALRRPEPRSTLLTSEKQQLLARLIQQFII